MSLNANDLYAIQECLLSYKVLLNWIPAINKEETDLKYVRLQTINHLCDVCDNELGEIKNG